MRDLSDVYLYGIVDLAYVATSRVPEVAEAMIDGGVDLIQLRGKEAKVEQLTALAAELHRMTSRASVPLIVNDYAEIARRVPVEGVHVGQDDEAISAVRTKVGRSIWVGKSTHRLEQARAAACEGADYIGFGPLYATPTKPDYVPIGLEHIKQVHGEVALPIFCIGGIKLENLPQVLGAGARRVVIVSALLQAGDVRHYAHSCKALLSGSLNSRRLNSLPI